MGDISFAADVSTESCQNWEQRNSRASFVDMVVPELPFAGFKLDWRGTLQSIKLLADLRSVSLTKEWQSGYSYFSDAACALCPLRTALWTTWGMGWVVSRPSGPRFRLACGLPCCGIGWVVSRPGGPLFCRPNLEGPSGIFGISLATCLVVASVPIFDSDVLLDMPMEYSRTK